MHKILKRLFSRLFFVAVSILVQVIWFIGLVYLLGTRFQPFYVIQQAACIVAVLWLVNKRINPAYKLAWTILILSIPVVEPVFTFFSENPGWPGRWSAVLPMPPGPAGTC